MLGIFTGFVYVLYFWFSHRQQYKEKGISMPRAIVFLMKGFFETRSEFINIQISIMAGVLTIECVL